MIYSINIFIFPSINVLFGNGVISTIRKRIVSKYTLSGGEENVRGDKAAALGVVVPGLQIVPLRLLVVNVASVAERVQNA